MSWRRFFRRSKWDEERARELASYLETETEENIARGMTREEARRTAHIKLGNATRIREEIYEMNSIGWLETLWQDLRYGVRVLRKAPGFTTVAVLTLALGIGASTVGFSVFYNLLFNAFAAKNASRLAVPIVLDTSSPGDIRPLSCSVSDLDLVRQQNQVFENIVGYIPVGMVLLNDGSQTYQFYDGRVTSDAFEFYGVPALLGRGIAPQDGKTGAPPVFVMSYKTWKGSFNGDPKILGKTYTVDDEPRMLVGVMPPRFQAFGPLAQIWIPVTWTHAPSSGNEPEINLLGRLKPGATLQAASSNFDVIVKRLAALHPDDFPKHFAARVESADDLLMGPQAGGAASFSDMKDLVYDLLVTVMILLLIACSNVANLLLARATVRRKEIAVRAALGATRRRLVRQLLVESSVLAIASCVVGCVFAWFGMKIVATALPDVGRGASYWAYIGGEVSIGLNIPVLAFAILVTLFTTMICGLAPALHAVRADMQPQLSGSGRGMRAFGHGKLRAGLVIGEVALSIVLLVGAGLMIRTLFLLTHVDLGFNPKNVLLVLFMPSRGYDLGVDRAKATSAEGMATLREVADRLKTLPDVMDVAVEDTIPGYGPGDGPEVTVPGAGHAEKAGLLACDQGFLRTVELRLTQGRWLSRDEVQTARHVAVINQKLAHDFFGGGNPVGQELDVKKFKGVSISSQDTYFEIVGVVADIKSRPEKPAMPMAFVPVTVRGGFILLLKTRVAPASLVRTVQKQVWAVNRDEIFVFSKPLTDFLHELTYATPEFGVTTFAPLAGIAILLVIAGVFSVMAYTVSLQTHEIGIRMALGAQQSNILKMVLGRGLRLIVAGIVVGVVVSLGLTRFIASQIWGISATDPWTFAAVTILLTIVALMACYIPARRAMRVDPMEALRYE